MLTDLKIKAMALDYPGSAPTQKQYLGIPEFIIKKNSTNLEHSTREKKRIYNI